MVDSKPVRLHVFYKGQVQGVGFRYTAVRLARGFGVSGYVQNLPDGRVELVAEGDRREVESFVARVGEVMAGHIRHADIQQGATTGEFEGFAIRY